MRRREQNRVINSVRQARERIGLTQGGLAERIGKHPKYVGQLERNEVANPGAHVLLLISRETDTALADLVRLATDAEKVVQ
jgi:transcriptional regulator with XRE-family HTH domain